MIYHLAPSLDDKRVDNFRKSIGPKVYVISRLEFELACFQAAVQIVSHYAMGTLPAVTNMRESGCWFGLFILMAYQLLMGYPILKFDSFVNV